MAAQRTDMPPKAVLLYVEQMLIELARMTEEAGLPGLAHRIEILAAETALEVTSMAFNSSSPARLPGTPRDRLD